MPDWADSTCPKTWMSKTSYTESEWKCSRQKKEMRQALRENCAKYAQELAGGPELLKYSEWRRQRGGEIREEMEEAD